MPKRDIRPTVYVPRVGTEITWRKRRVRIVEVVQNAKTYEVVGVRITELTGSSTLARGMYTRLIAHPKSLDIILKEAHRVEGL